MFEVNRPFALLRMLTNVSCEQKWIISLSEIICSAKPNNPTGKKKMIGKKNSN